MSALPILDFPGLTTEESDALAFGDLGLPTPLVAELTRQGLTVAFPIQAATVPDSLSGRDVLGFVQRRGESKSP